MTGIDAGEVVMGFHPTSRGFGWVVFEGPGAPYDWGLTYARADKNKTCLQQVRLLLERHRPETLVLEQFDRRTGKRASRVSKLCLDVAALARELGVAVAVYTRADIRRVFGLSPKDGRQRVAERVADHIEGFRHRLPKARKPWDGSDRRMALFSAAALVLTHFGESDDR